MKILKYVLLLLAIYIILPCAIFAQRNGVTTTNIRISVVKSLQINKIKGNLSFNDIVQTGISTKVTRTPDKGVLFEVNGNPGHGVTFDFGSTLLNNNLDNDQLNFIPKVAHTQSNTNYISPSEVTNGSTHRLENINGKGCLYLWVGGEIDLDKNLSSGDYLGEFLVTVSY